jgi:hypothetical protein
MLCKTSSFATTVGSARSLVGCVKVKDLSTRTRTAQPTIARKPVRIPTVLRYWFEKQRRIASRRL